MSAITIEGLVKEYSTTTAVRDFDLKIKRGEVFGFLGPNGAGKSTIIDLLLGFREPTDGEISILGHNPEDSPYTVRKHIGVLPDNYSLYDHLTGREHVEYATQIGEFDIKPKSILERVGLEGEGDQRAKGYSKGMRQRLALGIALVGNPEILILDEPTTGIDPNGVQEFQAIINQESNNGTTVFFSSHSLEQVQAVCDRIGIIDAGELLTVSKIDELRKSLNRDSTLVLTVDTVPDNHGLLDLNHVNNVSETDTTLRIDCTDPSAKSSVINCVETAGATVTDINVENASLADLFEKVTNGGYRE
ncbi:ABC transporter ATP-binding protein [Halorussus sp. MSC15.2]|uniref:ABC transporter ATP-binding protein n=1 Tax=Halorussus sp. MSC15.2 TaxID=2283638 RepID=UPI0013D01335|nr:ABC transporter ATP-binding protein [Halorussus sp. MSC15.2]NEU55618.1 ABC transporter ATP-binding protein [Halorussus sp. MSC15.2]